MEDIKYTPANYKSDQAVRWCPGCGDHAILNTLHKAMASVGVPPHKMAVISGIGCSSRLPYYMNTYEDPAIRKYAFADYDLESAELIRA